MPHVKCTRLSLCRSGSGSDYMVCHPGRLRASPSSRPGRAKACHLGTSYSLCGPAPPPCHPPPPSSFSKSICLTALPLSPSVLHSGCAASTQTKVESQEGRAHTRPPCQDPERDSSDRRAACRSTDSGPWLQELTGPSTEATLKGGNDRGRVLNLTD